MTVDPSPLIVQYLYVHSPDERFFYPSARSAPSVSRIACRYLECAVVQAASLRLPRTPCELALVTNIEERALLGHSGIQLFEQLDALGVRIIHADYRHRPTDPSKIFLASRYVFDAVLAAAGGQPPGRQLWFTDLDCVWPNAQLMFAHLRSDDRVGAIEAPYGPDWVVADGAEIGRTRNEIAKLATQLGYPPRTIPPWIGGELLCGTADVLLALVGACENLDERLAVNGMNLSTEEQLLTLAGALGLVSYEDLSQVARRIWTGPRHGAPGVESPLSLGLWHLPAEKGLSLRRAARQIRSGRTRRLRADLADPAKMARRFNVQGNGPLHRIRDDCWLTMQRIGNAGRSVAEARSRIQSP
jgi:hypothetical protein